MMWHKWTKKSFIDVMKLGCAILLSAAPWILWDRTIQDPLARYDAVTGIGDLFVVEPVAK